MIDIWDKELEEAILNEQKNKRRRERKRKIRNNRKKRLKGNRDGQINKGI